MDPEVGSHPQRWWGLVGRWILVAATVLSVVTTCWIEYLNWKAGGAIENKLAREPHSKWRVASRAAELRCARQEIRFRHGGAGEQALSTEQEAEAARMADAACASPGNQLARFLRHWGLWQTLLAMAVAGAGLVKVVYSERKRTALFLWITAFGGI